MKRILCILLSVCLLLCLAACGTGPAENSPAVTEPPVMTEGSEAHAPDDIQILTLEKSLHTYHEWAEELPQALVLSEHSYITLGQKDAKVFPEMAEVLNQIAVMQENAMLEEFYNLVSIAYEKLDKNPANFETYVSTLDVQVRRADSLVLSVLTDSYSDFGQIDNYRVFHGSNYDPKTGKKLALNQVVDVNNDLAIAVEKELTGHMWTGEFYSESAVQDYFANTPYDGFSWTLDYNGVTFYFAPGELCEGGAMTATVSFAQYPELFRGEYGTASAAYTVELPMDISFFTDLNGDNALEEVSLSGWRDAERDSYRDFGIFTATDFYYEECFVYDFHPYYVKTADGHFLYLFCEDFQEGTRSMELIVLRLGEDGKVTKLGAANLSPSFLADNRFLLPLDPGNLILDDNDSGIQKNRFFAGSDGLPHS